MIQASNNFHIVTSHIKVIYTLDKYNLQNTLSLETYFAN